VIQRLTWIVSLSVWMACAFALVPGATAAPLRKPNFVIIFVDDMGYGDLGCFGNPVIATPHLDRMASEGQKWTHFYSSASVCTPSRAGLLTGRLAIRSGMCSNLAERVVLFPESGGGLPTSEITIAEAVKPSGYATAAFGKWHLGHLPQFLPTTQGFDTYYGIPYSNSMAQTGGPNYRLTALGDANFLADIKNYNVPIIHDTKEVERPADQFTITRRYTERAVSFIKQNKARPFFVYLAHSMPHIPMFASDAFRGKSRRGIYGDAIEEVDWSVGQILDTLRSEGLDKNTLVVFTSDNGPALNVGTHGGSAGLLRGGKGGTYEGGMREPTIFWGPNIVKPGVVGEMGATLDLLPTFCALAGIDPPQDRILDGGDLSPVLEGTGKSPRQTVFFYRGEDIWAVRHGPYKVHYTTKELPFGDTPVVKHDPPLLFHLDHDPSEKINVAPSHADVIDRIQDLVQQHRKSIKPVVNQLEIWRGK